MTLTEARKIARIAATVDGGCDTCVNDLINQLNHAALGVTFEITNKLLWAREYRDYRDQREASYRYIRVARS